MITNDEGDRLSDASEQDLKFIDIENLIRGKSKVTNKF
jgi:hypothetical protein